MLGMYQRDQVIIPKACYSFMWLGSGTVAVSALLLVQVPASQNLKQALGFQFNQSILSGIGFP